MKDIHKERLLAAASGKTKEEPKVEEPELDVHFLYSIVVSIFQVGGMLGGFSGGIIANRFGRFVKLISTDPDFNGFRPFLKNSPFLGKGDYCSTIYWELLVAA